MTMAQVDDLSKVLVISIGDSRRSTYWQPRRMTWRQFCERFSEPIRTAETSEGYKAMSRDEKADAKDVGGFVGGAVEGGNRKGGSVAERQLLALDADYGNSDIWDNWGLMVGGAALLHSTHSHTPEKPRLRILIPLARPVTAEEYEPVGRRIAQWLGIEAFDDTTYEPSRLMYWPSCPADGEYIFKYADGDWLDPDMVLDTYTDWRNMAEWPRSSRQQKLIRKMGEKQGDPLTKPGVVGAFNRAYKITDAIVKFLPETYVPAGAGRWTFTGGSTVGGAVVYDDDTFLYSHHDHDPVSGRLCNAYDLVRLHLYGAQDEGVDETLDKLPSTLAMRVLCSQDEAVRAELAEAIKRDPSEVFDVGDGLQRFLDDNTEQGITALFVDRYGHHLRYAKAFGWLFWDGAKWATDADAEAAMLVMEFADELYSQAHVAMAAATDKPAKARAEALMRAACKLRTATGQKNILKIAAAILHDGQPEDYDADPWILNTPGGIVDLRTGETREHNHRDKCTKITACPVDFHAKADMWNAFIDHVTGGDVEFARYLQMLAGMAAVGAVYEEGLVISYGPGGNGKSTFFGALRRVLGDYARGINADVLVSTRGTTDQSYVAALRGVRLAVMGETEEGAHMSAAQMKRLTSRDKISARALYKDPIEFTPTHTTIMHTNHLPRLSSLDGGTKRRIAAALFPATLPPERVITDYESVLVRECGPAIMAWIVDGARRFYSVGCKLALPASVQATTRAYLHSEDWLQEFIDECCVVGRGLNENGGELYSAYADWAAKNQGYVRRGRDFGEGLKMKGFEKNRAQNRACWHGLALRWKVEGEQPGV